MNVPALPAWWPSAWPHLYPGPRDRAIFVAAVIALTAVGLVFLGDPAAQWWAIALPLLLLIGPATRPGRARLALSRAVRSGIASTLAGRLVPGQDGVWLQPGNGDPAVPVTGGPAGRALRRYAGAPAVLVWRGSGRSVAAVVLDGGGVAYLPRRPRGVRAGADLPTIGDEAGWTLPTG